MSQFNAESWLERAQQMVTQRTEALEFISRVRGQLAQAQRRHAAAVASLWLIADDLDEQMSGLLEEMNRGLLQGEGQQDVTRGASVGPLAQRQDLFFYNCAWLLEWSSGLGITIEMALDPDEDALFLQVGGHRSEESFPADYPTQDLDALREALVSAFVAEVTADSFPEVEDTPQPAKYSTEASEFMDQFQQMLSRQEGQPPSP